MVERVINFLKCIEWLKIYLGYIDLVSGGNFFRLLKYIDWWKM